MRHYDVQMIGGMVLHQGRIAEMRTGEGKTLVATLPTYLNALAGKGVHVVTVNDYLAKRDAEWMGRHPRLPRPHAPASIVHGLDDFERQRNYNCDITYGQNNEFGFDYLRDNMKTSPDRMVQRGLNYAVVDEVDSILIDEARTPLIISGAGRGSRRDLYVKVDRLIPRLKREVDYTVDEKAHSAMLTDDGVEKMEKLLGVDNLYEATNIQLVHHVNQALRAHTLYKRNVNYLVEDSKVVIVDEHTGRKMPGRRWSDGLHQAIEAKEGVDVEEENQTLATVTFQNYFRMYKKLSGMTGTADTEAAGVPPDLQARRHGHPDEQADDPQGSARPRLQERGRQVPRGRRATSRTATSAASRCSSVRSRSRSPRSSRTSCKAKGLPFNVLNAKQHQREASIVAQAGRKGAITIATNMAGRGTDIFLGGNPEAMAKDALAEEKAEARRGGRGREADRRRRGRMATRTAARADARLRRGQAPRGAASPQFKKQCEAEREEVLAAGGLKIVGTERHESRRIDNQLRGRAGRQGDPGSVAVLPVAAGRPAPHLRPRPMTGLMERLGLEEDVPIESPMVTRSIENAQKKVEGRNFDQRKNVLEYDDVMNQQRKTIYALRRQILEGRYHPEPTEDDRRSAASSPSRSRRAATGRRQTIAPEVEKSSPR